MRVRLRESGQHASFLELVLHPESEVAQLVDFPFEVLDAGMVEVFPHEGFLTDLIVQYGRLAFLDLEGKGLGLFLDQVGKGDHVVLSQDIRLMLADHLPEEGLTI
jgi:hypothetical protein